MGDHFNKVSSIDDGVVTAVSIVKDVDVSASVGEIL